jgi:5-methyltetrahydropteroyltriglutamate--homocysteine methyltransferase
MEASRSQMELLNAFVEFRYPADIGPGVWDIHSPRVPSVDEIESLLRKALVVLTPEQLWVNPDCGLKTRLPFAETALTFVAVRCRSLKRRCRSLTFALVR